MGLWIMWEILLRSGNMGKLMVVPIGLDSIRQEVESTCAKAKVYQKLGVPPQSLIVPLNEGNGRTMLLAYVADMYQEFGVLDFSCSPDLYLETRLDGSSTQMKQTFSSICEAAVYANQYTNVVGMDISEMAAHMNENQFSEFLQQIKALCAEAYVIFFVHEERGKNEERLIERILDAVDMVKWMPVEGYSEEQLCEVVKRVWTEKGIWLEEPNFYESLQKQIHEREVQTVREALLTAQRIFLELLENPEKGESFVGKK